MNFNADQYKIIKKIIMNEQLSNKEQTIMKYNKKFIIDLKTFMKNLNYYKQDINEILKYIPQIIKLKKIILKIINFIFN